MIYSDATAVLGLMPRGYLRLKNCKPNEMLFHVNFLFSFCSPAFIFMHTFEKHFSFAPRPYWEQCRKFPGFPDFYLSDLASKILQIEPAQRELLHMWLMKKLISICDCCVGNH